MSEIMPNWDPWMEHSVCSTDRYAEAWFSDEPEEQEYAKNKCGTCPVATRCLTKAIEGRETFGIWGGLMPVERRLLWGDDKTCKKGHTPRTHKDLYWDKNAGSVSCRICRRAADVRNYEARLEQNRASRARKLAEFNAKKKGEAA